MPENKYKFNSDTLEYELSNKSRRKKIFNFIISTMFASILIAIVLTVVFASVTETPRQRLVKREIKIMKEKYESLSKHEALTKKHLIELQEKDRAIYRAIFESEPDIDSSLLKNPYERFENVDILPIVDENKERLKKLYNSLKNRRIEYNNIMKLLKSKKDEIENIPAIQPIINNELKQQVYGFGNRIDPFYKVPAFHSGIDFMAPENTNVYATANGKVITSDRKKTHGITIVINHHNGYKTIYSHLKTAIAKRGKKVKRGDIIGTVGNTGKSFFPHLHYEVQYKKKPINPVNYFFLDLTPEQYYKIRYAASKAGLSLD